MLELIAIVLYYFIFYPIGYVSLLIKRTNEVQEEKELTKVNSRNIMKLGHKIADKIKIFLQSIGVVLLYIITGFMILMLLFVIIRVLFLLFS